MKAIAYQHSLPISNPLALQDVDLPAPEARGHDLLVEVKAIAVNPVDHKIRQGVQPEAGQWKVLGWDAAGVVRAVGEQVTRFKVGDRVWYAGAIDRPGSYAELQLVDEHLVGAMPASLDFAAAAALPLTTITAWELLFERLGVEQGGGQGQSLLVIGAAGGVGSILVQLARQLTQLTVIATASRPETEAWVRELGAHQVINHRRPLAEEIQRLGLPAPQLVASLTETGAHFAQIVELMAPQGKLALIDDLQPGQLDVMALKRKSLSLHWEMMFTRSLFNTADKIRQGELLSEAARRVDAGTLRSTVGEHFGRINASNLRRAQALQESGAARGKIVLEGF
ncbi:zinc-binding alcohol dehydrogenase family protein [Inhella proteolytica]|uniref:Zinc-type alcohol dehydrogenase-like protein n=1 Tax=Inhella proteolytica TaxID=2795029 RepID=A0A931J3Y4_9BURK|nr:zinc-binding alcohol dehydrogenase family protein [Inhella proteolytica]MBH9578318.1 zinc-binding alcohol dehydrogenase family protein [Inhella proteolytica]